MEKRTIAPHAYSPIDSCRGRGKHHTVVSRIKSDNAMEKKKSDTFIQTVTIYLSPSESCGEKKENKSTQ
jgi:hypothetical protein